MYNERVGVVTNFLYSKSIDQQEDNMPEKKKNIFQSAIDALTGKDAKEAADKAAAEKVAAERAGLEEAARQSDEARRQDEVAAQQALVAAQMKEAEDEAARQAADAKADAERQAAEAEAKLQQEMKERELERQRAEEWQAMQAAAAAKPKIIAQYELKPDDTLSHVALKFYGNAARDFWMLIYEANKDVIGPNPGIVRPGTVLQIPELPDALK